jgi:glutaconate CoA-transferase, subunit A
LGHNYRRAAEAGIPHPMEIEEHSNFTVGLALQAGAMGLPFLPTRTIKGSDFAKAPQFNTVRCPFTGEKLLAVRAIQPDVAILHAQRADRDGNAQVWGNFGVMREAALAAKKVILTCEEIVDHEMIIGDPNRTVIPGFVVSSLVHEPFGSFPSPTQGFARRDDDFYFEYHRATRAREGFENWLREWVLGVDNHREFLKRLSQARIDGLRPENNLFTPAVNFSY